MNKKKICILSNGLWHGGTDTFIVNLVKGLDKNKYDITVLLSISDNWLADREPEILAAGAKTYRTYGITGKGVKGRIKHLVRLYKYLRKEKPDIFQTNIDLFNGPNLFVSWLARVPIRICHSHNSMQEKEVSLGKNIFVIFYQRLMRWMCWHFSNRRAGCSEEALNFLFLDKWKSDPRAIIINNGIDLSLFKIEVDKKKKLKELGSFAPVNILTIGRLSLQKNPIFIASVFYQLCKKRDDCNLIWVGVGDMEEQIKESLMLNGILDKVHFLGIRDDINEIMKCCDVFLFPSIFEGLGIVVIEAQASSLPCLVSDAVPKLADCGGCEFLSLQESKSVWSEHLNNILQKKITMQISEEKLQEFSIEHMVKQMESLFE